MPRSLYEKVRADVLEVDAYFSQLSDAAGAMGASTDQKITAAMRQLASGCPADAAAELVRVIESLANESLLRYCRAVRKKFEPEYLRRPNKDELREIEQHYASLGFPVSALVALTSRRGGGIAVQLDGKGSTQARIRSPATGWRWFATTFCVFRTSTLEHQGPGTILIFTISQRSLQISGLGSGQRLSRR
jgi:hypothetical protein